LPAKKPRKERKQRAKNKSARHDAPKLSKNDAKAALRDIIEPEMADYIHEHIHDNTVPVFLTLDYLPLDFDTEIKNQGGDIVAAARQYGVAELFSGDLAICVMWNMLPESRHDGRKYQIHHHVKYRDIGANGKARPKEMSKDLKAALVKKKRELAEQDEKVSQLIAKSKKEKGRKLRAVREELYSEEIVKDEIRKELKALNDKAAQETFHDPNSHIYPPFSKSIGACHALDQDAIDAAIAFKNEALRDAAHLRTAYRKSRPRKGAENYKSPEERGKAIVEWEEGKGERQMFGFKMFMKKHSADADAEAEDEEETKEETGDEGKVVFENEKVNTVAFPFSRQQMGALTRTKSEEKAVTRYLSKSREWKPYRLRTMDTD